MIIKFSKQTANAFAKIINDSKNEFKTLQNISDRAFSASCYWLQRQTQNITKTSKLELLARIVKN